MLPQKLLRLLLDTTHWKFWSPLFLKHDVATWSNFLQDRQYLTLHNSVGGFKAQIEHVVELLEP